MSWKRISLGKERDPVIVGGVDVWTTSWRSHGEEPIVVAHPTDPDRQQELSRYFIESRGTAHEFAAGEVAPGVWLFCEPDREIQRVVSLRIGSYVLGVVGAFILVHGFEKSAKFVALGSVLVALAFVGERYAKSKHGASKA
jgi:hypothetical protein